MKTRQQRLLEMIMSREQPTDSQAIINVPMKLRREARSKQLNATCPHCNKDVLDLLENSARDSGHGSQLPSTIFECPHCKREVEFELRWETVLCWARPVVEELCGTE